MASQADLARRFNVSQNTISKATVRGMTLADFIIKLLHLLLVEMPATIAWPVVILLIGRSHRDQFRDFFSRLIKVGPTGAEAVPPQMPSSLDKITNSEIGDSGSSLPIADEVISQIENNIREKLKLRNLSTLDQEAQRNLFIREYAMLALSYHFDIIASQIYGTQILALRELQNSSPLQSSKLNGLFELHRSEGKREEYNYT